MLQKGETGDTSISSDRTRSASKSRVKHRSTHLNFARPIVYARCYNKRKNHKIAKWFHFIIHCCWELYMYKNLTLNYVLIKFGALINIFAKHKTYNICDSCRGLKMTWLETYDVTKWWHVMINQCKVIYVMMVFALYESFTKYYNTDKQKSQFDISSIYICIYEFIIKRCWLRIGIKQTIFSITYIGIRKKHLI